jgi:hypothetical protein
MRAFLHAINSKYGAYFLSPPGFFLASIHLLCELCFGLYWHFKSVEFHQLVDFLDFFLRLQWECCFATLQGFSTHAIFPVSGDFACKERMMERSWPFVMATLSRFFLSVYFTLSLLLPVVYFRLLSTKFSLFPSSLAIHGVI